MGTKTNEAAKTETEVKAPRIGQAEYAKQLVTIGVDASAKTPAPVKTIAQFEQEFIKQFPKSNIAKEGDGTEGRENRVIALYNYAFRLAESPWRARFQKKLEAGELTDADVKTVMDGGTLVTKESAEATKKAADEKVKAAAKKAPAKKTQAKKPVQKAKPAAKATPAKETETA